MDFEYSAKTKDLLKRVNAFMDEWIYPPNEHKFYEEVGTGDRWQPAKIIKSLKVEARKAGLWNLFLPESELGDGLIRSPVRTHGPGGMVAGGLQLLRAGYG